MSRCVDEFHPKMENIFKRKKRAAEMDELYRRLPFRARRAARRKDKYGMSDAKLKCNTRITLNAVAPILIMKNMIL